MFKLDKITFLLIVIGTILVIPVILPYFHSGYFPTHDGEWAVVRAGEMFREIRDHQFPPRMSSALNFGYGYPLFNFTYPFPYYLSTLLHVFHLGFIDSIKFIFAASTLFSFYSMFALSSVFWKNKWAGFITSLFYIYLPYRLVDLYVRGSIGETIVFALYPLLILLCYLILVHKKKNVTLFFFALFSSVLVLTHNIMAVYFGIIFVFYLLSLILSRKYQEAILTFGAFVWGGLISAFFFIPALFEKNNIKLSKIPIADRNLYYVTFQKLLISPFGYGTPIDKNTFTYQLGIPQIIGFFLGIFSLLKLRSVEKNIVIMFSILTVLLLLMMFPVSSFMWKMPLLSDINYPWTLLLPIGFLMTFLSGGIIKTFKWGLYLGLVLAACAILLNVSNAKPTEFKQVPDSYYLTNEATTTSSNELMPLWVKKEPSAHFGKKVEADGNVESLLYDSKSISFIINSQKDQEIKINQIYYPGWTAMVNRKPDRITYKNTKGIMILPIKTGVNNTLIIFSETPVRIAADLISIVALLGLIAFGAASFSSTKMKH